MATGEMIGTGAGTLVGTLLFPGLGTATGAALGGALGGGIEGMIKSKKAENMPLPQTDPMQLEYLNTLLRKQRALETGMAYLPQQDVITQAGSKAQSNVMKLTGGDVGSAIASTIGVNRSTGRNLNELYGNMSMEGLKMMDLIGKMTDTIANRKLQIQSWEKARALQEANDMKRKAVENLMAVTASEKFADYLKGLTGTGTGTGTGKSTPLNVPEIPAMYDKNKSGFDYQNIMTNKSSSGNNLDMSNPNDVNYIHSLFYNLGTDNPYSIYNYE